MVQTINAKICIHNMPEEPMKHRYLVARQFITLDFGASLWYYGAFDEKKRAERAAIDLGNGVVMEVEQPVRIHLEEKEEDDAEE